MPHIVLLHGALGSPSDLRELASVIELQNFAVHTPSFSGHGSRPFQSRFGITQFATELETYIHSNHIEGCSVFGYSMGGYVALVLAAQQPDLMGKIITLGTKFNWNADNIEREKSLCHAPTIAAKQPDFARALKTAHHDWEMLVQKTSQMIADFSGSELLSDQILGLISNPVLLCLAENDKMVSLEETKHVLEMLQNAQLSTLLGSKHALASVNMKMLSSKIIDFVLSH